MQFTDYFSILKIDYMIQTIFKAYLFSQQDSIDKRFNNIVLLDFNSIYERKFIEIHK